MPQWKCDFGFRPVSLWYGNFRSREDLEKYAWESFLDEVGIPDTRTARHYSDILFSHHGSVSDLVAHLHGSSYYAPRMEEEVVKQKCGEFNSGFLLSGFAPPDKNLDQKYHSRKLKHLGFFKTHGAANSLAEKRGGAAAHKNYLSVWVCDFKNTRSLKAHFKWPNFEQFHNSKFAKDNQLGPSFEEELSELTCTAHNELVSVRELLDEHTFHSKNQKDVIADLCSRSRITQARAIYVAFDYNHENTVEFTPATNRVESRQCRFVGAVKATAGRRKAPSSRGTKGSQTPRQKAKKPAKKK